MNEHKTVLITGATSKLGYKLALGFASLGYTLIMPIRSCQRATDLKVACMQTGAQEVVLLSTDLTSGDAMAEILAEIKKQSIFSDIIVNCAKNIDYLKPNDRGLINRENWLSEFLLNVVVPYELTMVLTNIQDSNLKKAINISSISVVVTPKIRLHENYIKESPTDYGVVKAALIHLTKELAVRLAPSGVEVNTVSYGGIDDGGNDTFKQSYLQLRLSDHVFSKKDIYCPAKFLASTDSNEMTGHNLIADGGRTI